LKLFETFDSHRFISPGLKKENEMNALELIQSIRLITDVCLEIAPGEDVLCIADREENLEILTLVAAECKARGAEVGVVLIEPRKHHHHEPPRSVARAMQEADVVIAMTFGSLAHTKARRDATDAGVKVALMGENTRESLSNIKLGREDLLEVRAVTQKIVERLSSSSSAQLITRAGTNLSMSLKGRKGVGLVPFGEKGTFFGVPVYAEAACPPIEDSVEGVAVIDGTMVGMAEIEGIVEDPFEITLEKGRLVKISGGRSAKKLEILLDTLGEDGRQLAELGVNSNHLIDNKFIGGRLDLAIAGNVHLGFGRNDMIGGNSKVECHFDLGLCYATLLLDGKPILQDGKLKI
jgi:leucyl aminopeptidase (aminopeptidase T)